ncbi:MAG: T9SS type A sorting domain-containing protein [Phaeodactylibacter sp.]|nr:T9SS type A sorting domain-containing protein [Phaeodactylibacter sp.]
MKVIIPIVLSAFLSFAFLPASGQDTITLSGHIRTPCGGPVPGVEILGVATDENGFYSVGLLEGEDYAIAPNLGGGWLDGVDHNDLALLAQHIDGQSPLGSPYLMIAADLNNSASITTLDAISLSQLLDGSLAAIPGNTSWRFISTDYVFPAPGNPWFELFPDVVNINNAPGDSTATEDLTMNFIAIKTGDLDCSAIPWPGPAGHLDGNIRRDENGNCQADNGEEGLGNWVVKATSAGGDFYAVTAAGGRYHMALPVGDYQVSAVPPNALWIPCASEVPASITEDTTLIRDFSVQAAAGCPYMEVDISPIALRRCATNTYQVRYCNAGTATAEGAYVKVTFDSHLTFVGSSLPWSSINWPTYTFPLGDIAPGDCGSFSIEAFLNCAALPGQAHCVEARIFPDSLCLPVPGPLLQIEGACAGDSVQFRIDNLGGDMPAGRHFIVIEDDLIMRTGEFQLNSGQSFELSLPANGATQRLLLDPPSDPGAAQPTLAVEACGPAGPEGPSLGFVAQYPTEAGNPFTDISCRENTGPFDPNDKQAFPRGQGPNRFLHPTSGLEYLIRFQNTGTDTAFLVVIRDTLPAELNPASLRPGASSHPYAYTLRGNGVAEFRFDNIMLPDSAANQDGSQGFIQFHIEQQPGNPNGAIIENNAAIYFDYNEPIITNYAWHTIDDHFLLPELASLRGAIYMENSLALSENAQVFLIRNGDTVAVDFGSGYSFDMLLSGHTYTVAPYSNDAPLLGVSTFDLVLLSKHILGIQPLGSPYRLLAADVNYSGSITALDMVALRRLILLIDTEPFPADKPAWRFVRADYVFPDPLDPWLEPIPSTAVFPNLVYCSGADFVGIKVGDLNGDAVAGRHGLESRGYLPLRLEAESKEGTTAFLAAPARAGEWAAFQAALRLPAGAALRDVRAGTQAGELAYSFSEDGILRLCWFHTEAVRFEQGVPLFIVELAPGFTPADELDPELIPGYSQAFAANGYRFELVLGDQEDEPGDIRIFPNPAAGALTLSGYAEAMDVFIRIYSPDGRTVYQASAPGGGTWQHVLPENALPAGVYGVEVYDGGRRWVERVVVGR